ncbi:MAG: hypothetical protein K9L62_00290 [Vallitaleaceae bacterium]|nr:hypothetical protein [Vallitaleaceae bacterium]
MLKREDYKSIKRMDRQHMHEYLNRVYMRGYEAGLRKSAGSTMIAKQDPAPAVLSDEKVQGGE